MQQPSSESTLPRGDVRSQTHGSRGAGTADAAASSARVPVRTCNSKGARMVRSNPFSARVATARLLAVLLIAAAASWAVPPASRAAANPVAAENSQPGDTAWQGAVTAHVNYVHPPISGYASATSVRPGGTIDFFVDDPQPGR